MWMEQGPGSKDPPPLTKPHLWWQLQWFYWEMMIMSLYFSNWDRSTKPVAHPGGHRFTLVRIWGKTRWHLSMGPPHKGTDWDRPRQGHSPGSTTEPAGRTEIQAIKASILAFNLVPFFSASKTRCSWLVGAFHGFCWVFHRRLRHFSFLFSISSC